jgi:hypothetical protein
MDYDRAADVDAALTDKKGTLMRGEKIPIDVLTCDPHHNIRCALMLQTLDLLPPEVLDVIERREWTLRTREGVRAFKAFKAKTVPTLCVDGHACFENLIPTTDQLYLAIATAARTDEQKDVILKAWSLSNAEEAPQRPQLVHHA